MRAGVLTASLLLAGCTVIRTDYADPIEGVEGVSGRFEVGVTTIEDVIADLGPPGVLSSLPEGSVIAYGSARVLELQIGLGIIDYLKLALGRGTAYRRVHVFTFDRGGRLVSECFGTRGENLGTGGSFQIAFAVKSVVDSSEIEEGLSPDHWATALLVPLDEGLNRASDLNSGMAGLEQGGTSSAVGQQTLEWAHR